MPSYDTIKPKNTNAANKTATDVHVTTYDPTIQPKPPNAPKLNVDGVDGKAPRDPSAPYRLDGDGSDTIDISKINVGVDGEIEIRLESPADKFPPVWVQWTDKGVVFNVPPDKFALATAASGQGQGTAAVAALDQIIGLATVARQAALQGCPGSSVSVG